MNDTARAKAATQLRDLASKLDEPVVCHCRPQRQGREVSYNTIDMTILRMFVCAYAGSLCEQWGWFTGGPLSRCDVLWARTTGGTCGLRRSPELQLRRRRVVGVMRHEHEIASTWSFPLLAASFVGPHSGHATMYDLARAYIETEAQENRARHRKDAVAAWESLASELKAWPHTQQLVTTGRFKWP
jgi:hypothetical protein